MGIDPKNSEIRAALCDHLERLRDSAAELGLAHLESAVDAALQRLAAEAFSPPSIRAVRTLAWQYEALAGLPTGSGTRWISQPSEGAVADSPPAPGSAPGGAPELAEPDSSEARLSGFQALVAESEPEVRWFYVGMLREAGARVIEARDGVRARELAVEIPPDVILADVDVPALDGLALCTAIRREPILDGTAVVLLSSRDDFLHRIDDLQPGAQHYLPKDLPADRALARVAATLEPLLRMDTLLRAHVETQGELERIGLAALIRLVRRRRSDVRLILQDPWSLFEAEFRGGTMVEITRTTIDGAVSRGRSVLPSLAGVRGGRFVVAALSAVEGTVELGLDDDLDAAMRKLGPTLSMLTEAPECRVAFDSDALDAYLRHTPETVRDWVARLAAGETPREVWESGAGSREAVDALLLDLARRGAVTDVTVHHETSTPDSRANIAPKESASVIVPPRGPEPSAELSERENLRAQSAVSMHQEPVNRVSRWNDLIWRGAYAHGYGAEPGSSFAVQQTLATQVLSWGFITVFLGTVVFLGFRAAGTSTVSAPAAPIVSDTEAPSEHIAEVGDPEDAPTDGLAAYAGSLREGVEPSLAVEPTGGALELKGPPEVEVSVDGIDAGPLPVTLALEEGRHLIRYRTQSSWTYRIYYVKRGATRTIEVSRGQGGFVDAR